MASLNLATAFNALFAAIASNPSAVANATSALGGAITTNSAVISQAQSLLSMFANAVQTKDAMTAGAAKIALLGLAGQLPASFNAAFSAMADPSVEADMAQFAIEGHQAAAALAAANSPGLFGSLFGRL